jgi:Protein of unknown function (DUF2894)
VEFTSEAAEPVQTLLSAIAALKERGEHRFDPVGFRCVEAVANRLAAYTEPVTEQLVARAREALRSYTQRLASAREDAAAQLISGSKLYPQQASVLRQHFERCEYREIKHLMLRLQPSGSAKLVAQLSASLSGYHPGDGSNTQATPLHELLEQQERAASQRYETANRPSELVPDTGAAELKATRSFRGLRARARADQVLQRAVEECPEDAGPLNPQRLTIASLSRMSELSPHYLNRFVAYMDTLIQLESLGKKIGQARK